jgi:hypothetical protein
VAAVLAAVLAAGVALVDRDPLVAKPAPSVTLQQSPTPDVEAPDFSTYPQEHKVASFTAVSTGIVYVEKESARVVWESWQHERRVIGQLGQDALRPADGPGMFFGNRRELVGNPMHDLVAWVETTGKRRGHLVVVRASTGKHLAATDVRDLLPRTDVRPPTRRVVIASVDAETVWFAPMDRNATAVNSVPGNEVRTWRWAVGEPPLVDRSRADQYVIDVSGGVWAIEGLAFQDAERRVLSQVSSFNSDRTYFGLALSPDGRYWFSPVYNAVIDTGTGRSGGLRGAPQNMQAYGWTGASTLTILNQGRTWDGMAGKAWTSCDARTGECARPQECDISYCKAPPPAP